jgi:hypothetical protein
VWVWNLVFHIKGRKNILRVCENKVLRTTYGPKREEAKGARGKLHDKLHNLYSSSNIIRIIKSSRPRWAECEGRNGGFRNALNILIGKCEGKRPTWET